MQVVSAGSITDSRIVNMSADTTKDVSLSKQLTAGDLRWTLEWNARPSDLDSHVLRGKAAACTGLSANSDREPCSTQGPATARAIQNIIEETLGRFGSVEPDYSRHSRDCTGDESCRIQFQIDRDVNLLPGEVSVVKHLRCYLRHEH